MTDHEDLCTMCPASNLLFFININLLNVSLSGYNYTIGIYFTVGFPHCDVIVSSIYKHIDFITYSLHGYCLAANKSFLVQW